MLLTEENATKAVEKIKAYPFWFPKTKGFVAPKRVSLVVLSDRIVCLKIIPKVVNNVEEQGSNSRIR